MTVWLLTLHWHNSLCQRLWSKWKPPVILRNSRAVCYRYVDLGLTKKIMVPDATKYSYSNIYFNSMDGATTMYKSWPQDPGQQPKRVQRETQSCYLLRMNVCKLGNPTCNYQAFIIFVTDFTILESIRRF